MPNYYIIYHVSEGKCYSMIAFSPRAALISFAKEILYFEISDPDNYDLSNIDADVFLFDSRPSIHELQREDC